MMMMIIIIIIIIIIILGLFTSSWTDALHCDVNV
jgi:hypothetical protein